MRYLPVTALTIVMTVSASGAAAEPGSKAADPQAQQRPFLPSNMNRHLPAIARSATTR